MKQDYDHYIYNILNMKSNQFNCKATKEGFIIVVD